MFGWSRKFALGLAALIALASMPGLGAATEAKSILRLSQRNGPSDLDPATATLPDEFFIIRALGEGLVNAATDGTPPRPAAAESWAVSPDGLVYRFRLRPNAKWSNGEAVTAGDFVSSYRRLLSPTTAAAKANLFFAVKNARTYNAGRLTDFSLVGFQALDPHTLVIALEQPTPNFLLYVGSGPWIPINPRAVAKFGRAWTKPENHVGNGRYTLTEWRANQRIVVRKSRTFPDANPKNPEEIQFIAFDNGDAEERAYRAGQIDITMAVPVAKLATYQRERPAEIHRTPLAETHYLSFNTRRSPLNDARVRRALALAIDRAKIVERVLQGGQQPAGRLLPAALTAGFQASSTGWEFGYAPNEARDLLAAAGFPNGKGFPRLEMSSWARPAVLEAVQAMWKQELGIEVSIALRDAKVHVDALRTGGYDIGFITQIPDVADAASALADFASLAPGNYPHWSDATFDRLLDESGRASDANERTAKLAEAERRLLELGVIAPLYFNAKNWLMSPRVRGWQEDALWTRDYGSVHLVP